MGVHRPAACATRCSGRFRVRLLYHSAGIKQRRPSFHAARKVGEVATVSARALSVVLARGAGGFFPGTGFGAIMSLRAGAPGLIKPHCPRTPSSPPSLSERRNMPVSKGPTQAFTEASGRYSLDRCRRM